MKLTPVQTKVRHKTYDETKKTLRIKSYKSLVKFFVSTIDDDSKITIQDLNVVEPGILEVDFLVRIENKDSTYLLHMETESIWKGILTIKRMLKYFVGLKEHTDELIHQMLLLLKKPKNTKKIETTFLEVASKHSKINYEFELVKVYEMCKEEVLKTKDQILYPFRIFMKYKEKTVEEHIKECIKVVEELEDKDYYYLTIKNIRKLYENSKYEEFIKEELLMYSDLYREPYEKGIQKGVNKGRQEGIKAGIKEGKQEGVIDTILKLLTKRFGPIPKKTRNQIYKTNLETLENIIDNIFDYESLDDVNLS